jgi:8-oxo-dGTP diphosphatase
MQNNPGMGRFLERPVLAVDVVLLSLIDGTLSVLLHQRSEAPFEGAWALPGTAIRPDEPLREAATRALVEKAGLAATDVRLVHLEQLVTQDGLYRDPRGRTVSVAHLGLVREPLPVVGGGTCWRAVADIGPQGLPFDHPETVGIALARLQGKLRYTNIAARLLPGTFRIAELEAAYRAILGRRLYRSNLRAKLLKIGLIERVRVLSEAVGRQGGRPPHLYRFRRDQLTAEGRDFL